MPTLPRTQREVMSVLAERGRSHAYEVKRVLTGVLGTSSIYAALSAAETKGYVTAEWERQEEAARSGRPARKYFELTALGHDVLAAAAPEEPAAGTERRATGEQAR